ncbi:MAG: hypothetical protein IKL72_05775 [Firmicutes bacterium]|nr:hypothetical protein [Bacillota bacterium]
MNDDVRNIPAFSIAFIIIGALFGAAFASGQEMLKFFCAYGSMGMLGFIVCFILYISFGVMVCELGRIRNSNKMEEIAAPSDSPALKKIISVVMLFCLLVILIALLAAGDALFMSQLNMPKGVGGLIITAFVIITNILGFDGIRKIMPVVIPVMLVIMLAITLGIIIFTEHVEPVDPGKFMSPLAPNWLLGALLYLAYNFIAAIPVLCTLPKNEKAKKQVYKGMFIGFFATCVFGFLIYCALMTDIDAAGTYELPMAYLSGKLSPVTGVIYSLIMVIAIYSASSNCLYGLTKELNKENKNKRMAVIVFIGAAAYLVSLVGFSQLVTYVYPVQGYACIMLMVLMLITFIKYKRKELKDQSNS